VAPADGEAYLGAMRIFNLKNVSPIDGFGDFFHYWRQPTPYRWQILGLSVALTFTMIVLFMPKTERAPPAQPEVIWINTFAPNRTEKEILESNIANQKRKDAEAAIRKQNDEVRRNFYRNLARASGFDPDELERQYSDPPPAAKRTPPKAEAAAPAKPTATSSTTVPAEHPAQ
jgi:hypothetical protein